MFQQKSAIGGLNTGAFYWSSTEFSQIEAWVQYFFTGFQIAEVTGDKDNQHKVRAIRAF